VGRSVAPPLEEAINGVENMIYMTSTSANDGSLSINVFFKQGTNADQAAVNVQNRVAQATSRLPAEVNEIGVSTIKRQNSMIMLVNLSSATDEYDLDLSAELRKDKMLSMIWRESPEWGRCRCMAIWITPCGSGCALKKWRHTG